jgi:hypothetical protein
MNIEGLDYNTQREKLALPEYGREIQRMVDHAKTLPDKKERQRCAQTIVAIMDRMFPQNRQNADYKHKLWDHLALMSNFELDIDWPYDIHQAADITTRPEPMPYPMKDIDLYVLLTIVIFCVMQLSGEWPMIGALAFNTLFIILFVAYVIYKDLPLKSLPVIGKYFKKS